MPKLHAEWLVGGHGVYVTAQPEVGTTVDWEAQVALQGVRKSVTCSADVQPWVDLASNASAGRARLPLDHSNAIQDLGGQENPVGMPQGARLRLMGLLGPTAHPMAGMGPVGHRWASRARWLPTRSSILDPFGSDGTHLGWPANTDLRYFQLAPTDQQAPVEAWAPGAEFALKGMGSDGRGYVGHLPRLAANLLLRRGKSAPMEHVSLRLQTVWFLPDADLGVLWWNGASPIPCMLSEEIDLAVVALSDIQAPLPREAMELVVSRRTSGRNASVYSMRDSDLLPARSAGWTWELILCAQDHPNMNPAPISHQACQDRVDAFESKVGGMLASTKELIQLKKEAAAQSWDAALELQMKAQPESAHWRRLLSGAPEHKNLDILHAELSEISVQGRKLDGVRFRGAKLNGARWSGSDSNNPLARLFEPLYKQLSLVNGAMLSGQVLSELDAFARMRSNAARQPEPIRGIMLDLINSGSRAGVSGARSVLSQSGAGASRAFCSQGLQTRYPFVRSAKAEVTVQDFERLFGPQGTMATQFKEQLAPYVDTSTSPWRAKRPDGNQGVVSADVVSAYESASRIGTAMLDDQGALRMGFMLRVVDMDPQIAEFVLEAGSTEIRYAHGRSSSRQVNWTGKPAGGKLMVRATVHTVDGRGDVQQFDGPWALFRFFDSGRPSGSEVDARETVHQTSVGSVRVRWQSLSTPSPLWSNLLQSFSCPR